MRSISGRFWLSLITILVFTCGLKAQKVEVTQDFVDSAAKAFNEVKVLRDLTATQKEVIASQDELIKTKNLYIEQLMLQNELLKKQIEEYSKLKCNQVSFFYGVVKIKRCK
jgi:hypothetical protein